MTSHVLRVALVLAGLSAPVVEHAAREHARAALARCSGDRHDCGALADWDVDADGLRLVGVERELAGARWSAARVHVGVDRHGVAVDVDELARTELPRPEAPAPATAPSPAPAAKPMRVDLHGIPAHVRVHGRIALPLPRGASATVIDPIVAVDAGGTPRASATAIVTLPGEHELVLADAHVEPGELGRWRVAANASIDAGPVVAVVGELSTSRVQLRVTTTGDARLEILADKGVSPPVASVHARGWPLATVGPGVAARLGARGIDVGDASIDGDVELSLGPTPAMRVDGLVVHGVRIDDPRLATRAVRFAALAVDGTVRRSEAGWHAEAAVSHRDLHVHAKVVLEGERLRVAAGVDELACEQLLAAMPDGMADTLAGARLAGSIAGTVEIEVELDRLASVDLDADRPPGTLAFDIPLLESCRTIADPAGIDLAALAGPYRHVFVAGGRRHDRVLAPGAPGFVALSRAPHVAAAFVALEDMRFRSHDGFDRQQIERAFWHNLVAGGVRRGASTISQQTARNLWLGVDRSLARKLQEAWLTARLEATVEKDRILELYVNLIELGPGVFGIDEGARHHFGLAPHELDVLQALHLASLAPAPRTLSKRFAGGEVDAAWLAELREHARRMHRNGMISEDQLMTALRSDLRLRVHASGAAAADAAP